MQKGLISVITPCWNTGNIVHRLLDSILRQDYPYVEMFVIDDGSKDNTKEVIQSYIPKFENRRGYSLKYIFQENQGQSTAINNGLKLVNGEFLVWPDSDDYYRSDAALSTFVDALKEASDEYASVRCVPTFIDENTLKDIAPANITDNQLTSTNLFLDCLYSRGFVFCPGNYLIKMEAFDKVNPSRTIYTEKNAGQNWQMHLPLLYSYKCLTLRESLHNVLVRKTSHSRGQYKTYEGQRAKTKSYENTLIETLKSIRLMPDEEKKKYLREIKIKYLKEQLFLAVAFMKKNEMTLYKNQLKEYGEKIPIGELLKVLVLASPFANFLRILKKAL